MSSNPHTPLLELADPELEWKRFERFCLDLARALPDVRDAHLYGTRGEKQHGIDIHADLTDGRVRTIQCRRVSRFTKSSATATIRDTTYKADEHRVWCTAPMSTGAREVLRTTRKWDGWDIEQISSAVRALPREIARWIVEDHLGSAARKRLLGPDGTLCLAPAQWWFGRRDSDDTYLPMNQPLVGRDEELDDLRRSFSNPAVRVLILPGRPGIGKTRLLRAIAEGASKDERVLLLPSGQQASADLSDELPQAPFTLLIDDADRRPDISGILATILATGETPTIILTTRPQHVPAMRSAIAGAGIAGHAIHEMSPLGPLSGDAAEALAEHAMGERGALSVRLGKWTRDIPALCVLGARLAQADRLDPAHLSSQDEAQHEILSRFREELLGDISEQVDRRLVRRLLEAISVLQPIEPHTEAQRAWLATFLDVDVVAIDEAVRVLEEAGLLTARGRQRRIAPDILADFILHDACIRDEVTTGYADRIAAQAPGDAMPRLLENLAELDWRLSEMDRPTVLDGIRSDLRRKMIEANAWDREQKLKQLDLAAPYLAAWIVELARDLLDRPASEIDIGFGHIVSDASARMAMVPLLRSAGLDLRVTKAAIALLWEIGRDGDTPNPILGEVEALKVAGDFGNYQLGLPYAEALLDVVEDLMGDEVEAEERSEVPLKLLQPMTTREGTRRAFRGHSIEVSPFLVSASATESLRTRLRELLVSFCLEGGDRSRPAAAALLGAMLTQPHGFFGQSIPDKALAQWRGEQLQLLEDARRVLVVTDDVLVATRLRDDIEWHARHSAIRGVKTKARDVLRSRPVDSEELLVRLLTQNIGPFAEDHEALERRYRLASLRVIKGTPAPRDLLDGIDAAIERIRRVAPDAHPQPSDLLGRLGRGDPSWGLQAASLLVDEPHRPSAAALGALLSEALGAAPEGTRAILKQLQAADNPMLRRFAADHVARMRWYGEADAPERDLAVKMAQDDDPIVVQCALLTALRLADHDPDLAQRIVLEVRSLAEPRVAKDVCMVLTHELDLSDEDEDLVLGRLVECPDVDYWQDRLVLQVAERRPMIALRYLLARLDRGKDDYGYRALPFDGLSADPVAGDPAARRGLLENLMDAAPKHFHSASMMDVELLYWSFAADADEAFEVMGNALASDQPDLRGAATGILDGAGPERILARPAWVAEQLGRADPSFLEDLQGALYGGLMTGSKQGTPGQPFPEDLRLRDKAGEHAAASRPGSRAANFWLAMVRTAERNIRESLERDALLDEGD